MILSRVPTPALAAELVSRPDGRSELARQVAARRTYAKTLRPCPKCGHEFGARDLRKHIPECGQPKTVVSRETI